MNDLINRELEQVAKEKLNLHSFIFLELVKKTELTDEFIEQALLNNDRVLGDCVYADTDTVKGEER